MKIFLIIANTRSGSTFFCDVASNYLNSEVAYEFYYDIYSDPSRMNKTFISWNQKIWGSQWLNGLRGDPVTSMGRLIKYAELAGREYLFFKVFNDQLEYKAIDDLVDYLNKNHDLSIVFISRKRIDSLISHEKAILSNGFHKVVSTNNRPRIGYRSILNRSKSIDSWFFNIHNMAIEKGIYHCFAEYSKNIDGGPGKVIDFLINSANIPRTDIKKTKRVSENFKQDLESSWINKISNGNEVLHMMESDKLVDYFNESFCKNIVNDHLDIC